MYLYMYICIYIYIYIYCVCVCVSRQTSLLTLSCKKLILLFKLKFSHSISSPQNYDPPSPSHVRAKYTAHIYTNAIFFSTLQFCFPYFFSGYQYRLCPADEPLTEACFQQMPLEFVKSQHRLLWNNGSLIHVLGEEQGVFVSGKGVTFGPDGSTWARNPIPRVNTDNRGLANVTDCNETGRNGGRNLPACQQFPALCPQDKGTFPMCSQTQGWPCSYDGSGQGVCSGDWTAGLIADQVIVPENIKPGKYVLGWRYDCEETAQVWQNCADVNIA